MASRSVLLRAPGDGNLTKSCGFDASGHRLRQPLHCRIPELMSHVSAVCCFLDVSGPFRFRVDQWAWFRLQLLSVYLLFFGFYAVGLGSKV